eukprot:9478409-Pyramimonas_sp.AAC.2
MAVENGGSSTPANGHVPDKAAAPTLSAMRFTFVLAACRAEQYRASTECTLPISVGDAICRAHKRPLIV